MNDSNDYKRIYMYEYFNLLTNAERIKFQDPKFYAESFYEYAKKERSRFSLMGGYDVNDVPPLPEPNSK